MEISSFKLAVSLAVLVSAQWFFLGAEAQTCNPSGKLKGRNPPPGGCDTGDQSECCKSGESYPIFKCSPPVTGHTKATLTLNSFEKGKDGGGPSECDGQYHSDKTQVVALSTGWFNKMSRCHKKITIYGNGKSTEAMVVDECDSTEGCDSDHDYQPPCNNNIVDGSPAVWKALGVSSGSSKYGWMDITWTDA